MILGLALVALSLPASATRYKVVCCNGTTQYINSVSVQAVREMGYMNPNEFLKIIREEGERLCSDHCVRNVIEEVSIGLLGYCPTYILKGALEPLIEEMAVHKRQDISERSEV